MRKIENWQIRIIHELKNILVIENDTYIALLNGQYGKDSSKDLSFFEASDLMHILTGKAIELGLWETKKERRTRFEDVQKKSGLASPRQMRMIEAMWVDRSYMRTLKEKRDSLNVFLAGIVKTDSLENLKKSDVPKVINALLNMKIRRRKNERKTI